MKDEIISIIYGSDVNKNLSRQNFRKKELDVSKLNHLPDLL